MTVTEGKQELIAFACVYYAKGMLDDKEYEALKLAIRSLEAWRKVRAEIEQITDTMGVSYNQYVSKIDVLQIIDNHLEELEEKNEC